MDDLNINEIINTQIGVVSQELLKNAGVYKCMEEG